MTNEKDIYQELSDKITEVIQLIPDTDENTMLVIDLHGIRSRIRENIKNKEETNES